MRYPLLFALLLFYSSNHHAQSLSCGTDKIAQQLITNKSSYAKEQLVYETAYRYKLSHPSPKKKRSKIPYIFPVVIHIMTDCSPIGSEINPPERKIKEVLTKTNERFRHSYLGAPSFEQPNYGIDTEIEFCLASVNPDGEFTTGIIRYNHSEYARGSIAELSPHFSEKFIWNTSRYLNIFLVEDTDVAGVYLGGSERDFIIINSNFLWDGLLTHELGHYFSLKHIFSNASDQACPLNTDCLLQGDFVCDTPPKGMAGKNGGSCEVPSNSCSTDEDDLSENNPYRPISMGGLGDQPDMLSNYMDYTGDCWAAFTQGQKERMHFNIEERRMSQLNNSSTNCTVTPLSYEIALEGVQILQDTLTAMWTPIVTIANNGNTDVTKLQVNFSVSTTRFSNEYATKIEPNSITAITLPSLDFPSGPQNVQVSITPSDNVTDAFIGNNQTCLSMDFGTSISSLGCQPVVLTKEIVVCNNEAIVEGYRGPGIFRDTFSMSNGCDSIRVLDIAVSSARIISEVDASICEGESLEGRSEKGAYIDIFTSATGCDSLRILNLSILPKIEQTFAVSICSGETYEGHSITGTYVDSLVSHSGCDSIRIVKLSVETTDNCLTTNTIDAIITTNINIFPNPVIDRLYIQSTAQEPITYSVYSITGMLMQAPSILRESNEVAVKAWSPGLYFLQFTTERGQSVRKIVVE